MHSRQSRRDSMRMALGQWSAAEHSVLAEHRPASYSFIRRSSWAFTAEALAPRPFVPSEALVDASEFASTEAKSVDDVVPEAGTGSKRPTISLMRAWTLDGTSTVLTSARIAPN